jgi:adenylate cyclase
MSLEPLHNELLDYPESSSLRREEIEKGLWERHGLEGAVMVLDMGRFSLITQKHGIIFYLALVANMQKIMKPVVTEFQGSIIKFEADNCFARFDDVQQAVGAAFAIKEAVKIYNQNSPNDCELSVKFGIDHGKFLVIGDDLWGDPVNCASKLGEDLAMAWDILVSQRAMKRIDEAEGVHDKVEFNVSDVVIEAVRV